MTPSKPKIHVMLASDAPIGVIFYRKSHLTTYCLSLDYGRSGKGFRDHITKGSRFYGRLFPQRCDLSADGQLMVYFAMRGKKTDGKSDPATWTAVCTPPWLKAHLFYPNGSTWGGGGRFLSNRRLFVADMRPQKANSDYSRFHGYEILYQLNQLTPEEAVLAKERYQPSAVVRMPCPVGKARAKQLILIKAPKQAQLGGYDQFEFKLESSTGRYVDGSDELLLANWAGWDKFGRLLVATGSTLKIYSMDHPYPLRGPTKVLDLENVIN